MRPIETRKFLQLLTKHVKKTKLRVWVDSSRGKGSHRGVVITHETIQGSITFTISGHEDQSPGIQRDILKYLDAKSESSKIAELIHEILDEIFNG